MHGTGVRLGAHLSIGRGWSQLLSEAVSLGCEAVQVFSRSPRGGKARPLGEAEAASFRAGLQREGISPLIIHTPYLVNIAAPDADKREYAVQVLAEDLGRAAMLGAPWVVVHMGHARTLPVLEGLSLCCQTLDEAFRRSHDLAVSSAGVTVLLENTAGGLGQALEAIGWVIQQSTTPERLGVCLDTCHAFAAGYDLRGESTLDEFFRQVGASFGVECIHLWHVNDSVGGLGSHIDRHAHLGQGQLGQKAFRLLLGRPEVQGRPMILETPVEKPGEYEADLALLRHIRAQIGGE